jgi:hypothetical protein
LDRLLGHLHVAIHTGSDVGNAISVRDLIKTNSCENAYYPMTTPLVVKMSIVFNNDPCILAASECSDPLASYAALVCLL